MLRGSHSGGESDGGHGISLDLIGQTCRLLNRQDTAGGVDLGPSEISLVSTDFSDAVALASPPVSLETGGLGLDQSWSRSRFMVTISACWASMMSWASFVASGFWPSATSC